MGHLYRNNLIDKNQHGFVRSKGCVTNLLETLDFITYAVSEGVPVDILYTDFLKAFDKVNHRLLIHKFRAYGFKGELSAWVEAFLNGRKQRVILGDEMSTWKSVLSGVPQGSVLGPVLFVIFINDLLEGLNNPGKLYADDSKLLGRVAKAEDSIFFQEDINKMVEWTVTWRMFFNCSKCKIMHIGKNNPNHNYFINDRKNGCIHQLEVVKEERDLGVIVSDDLKWKKQCEVAASKGNRALGTLKRTFSYLDVDMMKKLYTCYVRPHLEFAVTAWCPYLIGDISVLEKVQRRATRVHELKGMRYEERLHHFDFQTLKDRRRRGDLIEFYKIVHKLDGVNWFNPPRETFSRRSDGPASNLRGHSLKFAKVGAVNCNTRDKFFSNRVLDDWNKLDEETVRSLSTNSFKNSIDSRFFKI
jgi:hypothetical protein